jgi:hypothetical protein
MKKLNITPKAKKVILFSAIAVVGIGAVTLISTVKATSATEPASTSSAGLVLDNTSSELSIPPIQPSSSAASKAPVFVPSSGASQSAQLTTISKPTSAPPKPVVEGDASTASNGKMTPPTNSALTDKNHKPSYTSKPTAPTKPSSKPSSSTPSGGKPGQIYVPGFGWQYPTGGKGTVVSGMHEGGSQVGIMD